MGTELTRSDKALRTEQSELVNQWLDSLDGSDDTRLAYRISLEKFAAWLAERQPEAVTSAVIREWRDSLEGSPSSVNLRLSAVRAFYAWAVEEGHLAASPAAGVKGATRRGTSKAHKRDELTAGEVNAVLNACEGDEPTGTRDRALIALMAYTGLRTIEVHRADVGDLKTRNGRLVLWVWGKNHQAKDEFVVIPSAAEQELRRWLKLRGKLKAADPLFISLSPRNYGERMSRGAIRTTVKARYQAAGVVGEGKTTHSLRHSAISSAIRHGATPTQAQAMARHANVNTTLIYYHEIGRTTNPAEDLISYDDDDS